MGIMKNRLSEETEFHCDFCPSISTDGCFFVYIEKEESDEFADMIACLNCFKRLEKKGVINTMGREK